jgi:hypothetical protein
MATKKRKSAKKKTNPKRRRARARASNPPKRRRKRAVNAPKRRRARRASAVNPTRRRSRARAKNPPRRRRRARRSNPGFGNLMLAASALGAGVLSAVVSSWINDGPLGNASPAIQNLALLGEGLAAVYYVENPAYLGGIVVGLGLVTAGNLVYSVFPALAAPTPMTMGGRGPSTTAGPMGALHRNNVRQLRALDKSMARKHRRAGLGMGALHENLGALHMGALHPNMGALHRNDGMGELPQVATSWRSSVARMGRG